MVRGTFITLSDGGVLLFNMHHIASDGWSVDILLSDFVAGYTQLMDGSAIQWAPFEVQYADYALWQQQWLTSDGAKLSWLIGVSN